MSFADGFDFAMGALAASALVSVPLALLVLGGIVLAALLRVRRENKERKKGER